MMPTIANILFTLIGSLLGFLGNAAWDTWKGTADSERRVLWEPVAILVRDGTTSTQVREAVETARRGLGLASTPEVRVQLETTIRTGEAVADKFQESEEAARRELEAAAERDRRKVAEAAAVARAQAELEAAAKRQAEAEAAQAKKQSEAAQVTVEAEAAKRLSLTRAAKAQQEAMTLPLSVLRRIF